MNMPMVAQPGDCFYHHLIHPGDSVLDLLRLAGRPGFIICEQGWSTWYYSDHDWEWVVTIRKGRVGDISWR